MKLEHNVQKWMMNQLLYAGDTVMYWANEFGWLFAQHKQTIDMDLIPFTTVLELVLVNKKL